MQRINSRLIFLDSEINSNGTGKARIEVPSQPFSVTGSRDRMELVLLSFSMRRSWYPINATNNTFYTYESFNDVYQEHQIAPGVYYDHDELAAAVQVALRAPGGSYASSTCTYSATTRKLTFNWNAPPTSSICSFQVKQGIRPVGVSEQGFYSDTHEILGIIPSRTPTPVNGTGEPGDTQHDAPFPAQLNSLEAIYLRVNMQGGNFMTFGHGGQLLPDKNGLIETDIMARIGLNRSTYDEVLSYVQYQDTGGDQFKLHLQRKSLDQLVLTVTDDKGRPLAQVGNGQAELGLMSFNAVLRWDHVRDAPSEHQYTPQIKKKFVNAP